jgi:large subunit ribosomal protein L3e
LRRFYKNWYSSKSKKAFSRYQAENSKDAKRVEVQLNRIRKYCTVVRAIVHTQMNLMTNLRQKKNNIFEIQINGGKTVGDKVNFAHGFFEKEIRVDQVFG